MSGISTHVLDNSDGRPGVGLEVTLEFKTVTGWQIMGNGTTDDRGRIGNLLAIEDELVIGIYRITFDTGSYYRHKGQESFYPQVVVVFKVTRVEEHYHIPLLLNAFSYTTYRGN